jgi:serine/threonine-protein kinase
LGFKLFLITEFIEGPTLTELVASGGPLSFEDAAIVVPRLLSAIAYCHSNGWVHRDIKPDNIILRASSLEAPTLLDFGLGYKDQVLADFATEHGQELGNRFLRLPELSAGSPLKQDLRSDLAFIGGILFYLMTATAPSVLLDAEGRMPHQRSAATVSLRGAFKGSLPELLGLFDRAFSGKLSGRFASAAEMEARLDTLIAMQHGHVTKDSEEDLEAILSALKSDANIRLAKHKVLYDQAMNTIRGIQSELAQRVAPTYLKLGAAFSAFAETSACNRRWLVSISIGAIGLWGCEKVKSDKV